MRMLPILYYDCADRKTAWGILRSDIIQRGIRALYPPQYYSRYPYRPRRCCHFMLASMLTLLKDRFREITVMVIRSHTRVKRPIRLLLYTDPRCRMQFLLPCRCSYPLLIPLAHIRPRPCQVLNVWFRNLLSPFTPPDNIARRVLDNNPRRHLDNTPPVRLVNNIPPARLLDTNPPVRPLDNHPPARLLDNHPPVRHMDNAPPVRLLDNIPPVRQIDNAFSLRYLDNTPSVRHLDKTPPVRLLDNTLPVKP